MKLLLKSRCVKRRELVLTDKFCLSTYLVEFSSGTPLTTSQATAMTAAGE